MACMHLAGAAFAARMHNARFVIPLPLGRNNLPVFLARGRVWIISGGQNGGLWSFATLALGQERPKPRWTALNQFPNALSRHANPLRSTVSLVPPCAGGFGRPFHLNAMQSRELSRDHASSIAWSELISFISIALLSAFSARILNVSAVCRDQLEHLSKSIFDPSRYS